MGSFKMHPGISVSIPLLKERMRLVFHIFSSLLAVNLSACFDLRKTPKESSCWFPIKRANKPGKVTVFCFFPTRRLAPSRDDRSPRRLHRVSNLSSSKPFFF